MKFRLTLLITCCVIFSQSTIVRSQDHKNDITIPETNTKNRINSIGTPNFPIIFEGKSDQTNPPDLAIAAGPESIISVTNGQITAYNKITTGEIWNRQPKGFFLDLNQNSKLIDPHVIYDIKNGKFIIMYQLINFVNKLSQWVIAVSDNDHPDSLSSSWCFYNLNQRIFGGIEEDLMGDFPSMNIDWTNDVAHFTAPVYTIVNNDFGIYDHVIVTTVKLSNLYNCENPTGFQSKLYTDREGDRANIIQAAQAYTKDDVSYFVSDRYDTGPIAGETKVVVWTVPATSVLSPFSDQIIDTELRYEVKQNIRQKSGQDLEVPGTKILQAIYRDKTLWFTHSVLSTLGNDVSVRAYKYDMAASLLTIRRREAAGIDFSVPGIAVNRNNDALTIFNRSSSDEFISIRVAEFYSNSDELQAGLGTINFNTQWGDYARSTLDTNGIDFWIAHHYAKADGSGGIKIAGTNLLPNKVFLPLLIR
jgi:hypothetical protein